MNVPDNHPDEVWASTLPIHIQDLSPTHWAELIRAKALLESPSLPIRLSNLIGSPIEKAIQLMPAQWNATIQKATHKALTTALTVAVRTLARNRPSSYGSERLHKILVGTSGAVGGAFGLAALAIELPISTTLMLRAIADIARSEQHDLESIDVQIACMEVFALGGSTGSDDAAENAYWAVRAALAKTIAETAGHFVRRGVVDKSAPVIMRFISAIAARFGVVVSEQVAAKAVPVLGAAAGSAINILFMSHFQQMARGHFIVKRLERHYGIERVRDAYQSLAISPQTERINPCCGNADSPEPPQ